jgi:hypothetical protein
MDIFKLACHSHHAVTVVLGRQNLVVLRVEMMHVMGLQLDLNHHQIHLLQFNPMDALLVVDSTCITIIRMPEIQHKRYLDVVSVVILEEIIIG